LEISTKNLPNLSKSKKFTQFAFKIGHKIWHQTAGFGVGRSNGVIQISARPTLVAMVTKIGKFDQKIGYNSACV